MIQKSSYDQWVIQKIKISDIVVDGDAIYGKLKKTGQRNPIGYISRNGSMEICIMTDGKSVRYPFCRVIWLNANGRIPEGYIITHRDDDQLNNSLDNLQMEVYKHGEWNQFRWSQEDSEWLQKNRTNKSLPELSEHLDRSIKSVRNRIKNMDMPPKREKWREWTEKEDQKLADYYKQHMSVNEIAIVLNRSVNSVRLRANRILKAYRSDRHLQKTFRSKDFYTSLKQTTTRNTSRSQCCLCDYYKHIDLHHIDGDRTNSVVGNIASLCPNHHREVTAGEHSEMELHTIWWRVYSDGSTTEKFNNLQEVREYNNREGVNFFAQKK